MSIMHSLEVYKRSPYLAEAVVDYAALPMGFNRYHEADQGWIREQMARIGAG